MILIFMFPKQIGGRNECSFKKKKKSYLLFPSKQRYIVVT